MVLVKGKRFTTDMLIKLASLIDDDSVEVREDKIRKCRVSKFKARNKSIGDFVYLLEFSDGTACLKVE